MTLTSSPTTGTWQRLDRRMLVVHPVLDLTRMLPVIAVILISGGSENDLWRLVGSGATALLVLGYGASRWFTTSYRVDDDRVHLRTGLLRRHHRSVHRDRVRTADLTASPAHRLFGLAVVRVGTGERTGAEDRDLRLDAVGRDEAERLRALLLDEPALDTAPAPEIARLRWSWVRFAPLTFSALAVVGAVWAGLLRLAEEFGWTPADADRLRDAGEGAPVWLGAVALALTAVLGAAALFVEGWWGYRLTRAPDGGLLLRRGLLTRRSLSLEGRRVRGVELDEPLPLRLGRGARPLALTTGLHAEHGRGEHVGAVAPPCPRGEARDIAAATLGVPRGESVDAPLRRHPRTALVRRLTRATVPLAVVAAALWAPVGPWALLLVLAGLALGTARWRTLGHALAGRHLVTRSGFWVRRTVVLRRDGVIGWRLHQSLTQRRAGLVTLVAVSAAGRGHYAVVDVGAGRAIELVDAVSPGLLSPFLVPTAPSGGLVTPGDG